MPFTSPGTGIMPGVGGGGFMSGLSNLFQNKLFLQYLAAEGQDLLQNTPGKNLNAVTQQSITSENYMKLLKKMLAGENVPGASMTIDEKGHTFKLPAEALKPIPDSISPVTPPPSGTITPGGQFAMGSITPDVARFLSPFPTSQQIPLAPSSAGSPSEGVTAAAPVAQAQAPAAQDPLMEALIRSISGGGTNLGAVFGNMSKSDLAGLTPEMMSSALQFKMQQGQLGKKNIMDVLGMMTDIQRNKALENYYNQLGEQGKSSAEIARTREERLAKGDTLDQEFPVQVPGVGKVTTRQWNALPKDTQDYAMYVNSVLPGEKVLNPQEFKNLDPTVQEKFLRRAMEDPELMKAAKELRESGAIRITTGEKAEAAAAIKRATSAEEAWAQLHNPTQLNALVKKAVDDPVTANAIFAARDNPAEMTRIKGRTVAGVIDNMVRAGGGRFVKDTVLSKDGKTLTYTIKWPNHPEPEVFTYAIE